MQEHSEAISNSYRELFGIDGERIEFEANIIPGPTSLEILQKIQKHLQHQNTCNIENLCRRDHRVSDQ